MLVDLLICYYGPNLKERRRWYWFTPGSAFGGFVWQRFVRVAGSGHDSLGLALCDRTSVPHRSRDQRGPDSRRTFNRIRYW